MLNEILKDNGWLLVNKWHNFLRSELERLSVQCDEDFFQYFVREIINSTCIDKSESRWDSACNASEILKNYYINLYQIPFLRQ